MARSIQIDGLARAVTDAVRDYNTEVEERIPRAVREVARDTRSELRRTSPKRTGKYARAWSYKKMPGRFGRAVKYVVFVKPPFHRLAHLVEKGHATRSGGRVGAQTHIAPAEERAIAELEDRIRRIIEEAR